MLEVLSITQFHYIHVLSKSVCPNFFAAKVEQQSKCSKILKLIGSHVLANLVRALRNTCKKIIFLNLESLSWKSYLFKGVSILWYLLPVRSMNVWTSESPKIILCPTMFPSESPKTCCTSQKTLIVFLLDNPSFQEKS